MIRALIRSSILLAICASTAPAAEDAVRLLSQSIRQLYFNDRAGAMRGLSQVIAAVPPDSLPHHAAATLLDQMAGAMTQRHRPWLDRKVVDTVVLVGDEVSFVDAVAAWTPGRFWPVLFEDGWYAPLFIEAFAPRRVERFVSPRAPAPAIPPEQAAAFTTGAVANAIGDHQKNFGAAPPPVLPPGLVVIDPTSTQRCAGLALAVGRHQPILALAADSSIAREANQEYVHKLRQSILQAMRSLHLLDKPDWSALTLAGPFPLKYGHTGEKPGQLGLDDSLLRDERSIARGVAGRLMGDAVQSVYMAMGSLFCQPRRAMLLNNYWLNGEKMKTEPGSLYHLSTLHSVLANRMDATLLQNETATIDRFRKLTQPRHDLDWFWLNSSGGAASAAMRGGQFQSDDVPIGRSMLTYLCASFSAASPWNNQTIAYKSLAGGAFWYFGSTSEPYMQAFVQPTEFAHRLTPPTPLSFAAHQVAGHPFAKPWKLTTLGDPLFCLREKPAERLEAQSPLKGGLAVQPLTESAPPARRFHAALLLGDKETAGDLAVAIIADPGSVPESQLAQAMRLLADQGDETRLLAVPERLALRHPCAAIYLRRALRSALGKAVAAQDLQDARAKLTRYLSALPTREEATAFTKYWLIEMKKAARLSEGLAFLRSLTQNGAIPAETASAVNAALKEFSPADQSEK